MNKVIRNKQIVIDRDTCWKFGGDEGLGERLNFEVKGERWDFIPGEEIKFNDGKGKLLTSSCLQ